MNTWIDGGWLVFFCGWGQIVPTPTLGACRVCFASGFPSSGDDLEKKPSQTWLIDCSDFSDYIIFVSAEKSSSILDPSRPPHPTPNPGTAFSQPGEGRIISLVWTLHEAAVLICAPHIRVPPPSFQPRPSSSLCDETQILKWGLGAWRLGRRRADSGRDAL